MVHGEDLYPPALDPNQPPLYYPPLFAILLQPFALLSYPVFATLWEMGTMLVLVLFVRRVGWNRRTAITLGLLGAQVGDVLALGQGHAHITWLLALGTPFSIALAGQIKIFPALAALYWLGRREYRQFARFIGWSAALVAVQFIVAPAQTLTFAQTIGLSQVGNFDNWSPYAISPLLWAALMIAFVVITPLIARSRFGWVTAVAYATLSHPRLYGYHLLSLGAALRPPDPPVHRGTSRAADG